LKKLFIISRFCPLDQGGIEKAIKIYLDENERSRFYNIQSIFFNKKSFSYDQYKYTKFIEIKKYFKVFNNPFSISYFYLFFKNVKSCDILHFHFPNILAIFILLFLKKHNRKIIIHWHSDILTYKFLYFFIIPFEKIVISKSDFLIVTSLDYYKSSKSLKNLPRSKIKIIPTGSPKKYLSQSSKLYKKNYILSIGRLVKYKGFEKLILAYSVSKKLNDLIIIGNGPEYKKLINLIKIKKLSHKIKILTKIDDHKLINYLKFCDFFALTSQNRQEALGLVFIEAMKFKKAILSTYIKGSGVNTTVIHNYNGIVVRNEISEISKFLDILSSDYTLKKKLGIAGYKNFLKNFNSEIYIKNLNRLYGEIIE